MEIQEMFEKYNKYYTTEMIDKLIKELEPFKFWDKWWDIVSIWVEWKRPFWNSAVDDDIWQILWFEYVDDDENPYDFWDYEIDFIFYKIAERVNYLLWKKSKEEKEEELENLHINN